MEKILLILIGIIIGAIVGWSVISARIQKYYLKQIVELEGKIKSVDEFTKDMKTILEYQKRNESLLTEIIHSMHKHFGYISEILSVKD